MQGLDGDAAILLYPDPCYDALCQLHIWLCNEVQTIIDIVSHTYLYSRLV